jgi:hypothetical protein
MPASSMSGRGPTSGTRVAIRRLIDHHCLGPCTVRGCIDLFNVPFHHPIPRSAYRDGRANSYLEVETEVGT